MVLAQEPYRPTVPQGLDAFLPQTEDKLVTHESVSLGRQLFFDTRLSRDQDLSCSSCHDPKQAFTIPEDFGKGVDGHKTTRNPPALLNRVYGKSFFWDGRVKSLEQQVLQPIKNPKEMYLDLSELEGRLRQDVGYRRQFKAAFGQAPNSNGVARALADFVRSLLAGGSPYDRHLFGESNALTPAAKRGLDLFNGKANCWVCHAGPNLTDEKFHNTGVAWRNGKLQDQGRYIVTKDRADHGAFKTPTLRQVSQTAPYMHDGSLATLAQVVERYNQGGIKNPYLDSEVRPLNLNEREEKDLVAFLESLTGVIRFEAVTDEACH